MAGRSSSWVIGTQFNFTGQSTEIQLAPEGSVLERLWSHRKVTCHHRYSVFIKQKNMSTCLSKMLLFLFLVWCSAASTASSLKMNRNLRELHLAENKLTPFDALQLGILLTGNSSLQHVDLRYIKIEFLSQQMIKKTN